MGKRENFINIIKPNASVIVCVLSVLVILCVCIWSRTVKQASEHSINSLEEFYLEEIAERNVTNVISELERKRYELELALDSFDYGFERTNITIQDYIRFIQDVNGLDFFALVDSEGKIYTKDEIILDFPYMEQLYNSSKTSTVIEFKSLENDVMINFAAPFNKKTKDGKLIDLCLSAIKIDSLISKEQLSNDSSETFYEIYTRQGIPLFETDDNPLDEKDLFTYYKKNAVFDSEFSLEKVIKDWENGVEGYSVYSLEKQGQTYLHYKAVPNTDWMLATFMRDNRIDDVVNKSSKTIFVLTIVMIIIVATFLITIYLVIKVTIKKQKKSQLESEIERAANKAKTTFLFNMSHDIRTPMNAIIGYAGLVEKNIDNKPLITDYLHKIQDSSEVLLSLINNVLEIARIESGKERLNEVSWDVDSFNHTIGSVFDTLMKEKNIEFVRKINIERKNVLCDSMKVREIYLNIISNAFKYTPSGGSISMSIDEIPSKKDGYVYYKTVIADTGIGMSQDFLPHIFDEFTRERTSTESRVIGTGLGMQIVKKYIDLMEGSIDIESEVGVGTRVTVIIPYRIDEDHKTDQNFNKDISVNKELFKDKRILLAEDNELNAEIAIAILEELGFRVERAIDGVDCLNMLQKAKSDHYDLILMDIQMPNLDGYNATKRIRVLSDPRKAFIPIVAMTANAFEEDKKNAFAAGMNGHISKPIDTGKLVLTLSQIFERNC